MDPPDWQAPVGTPGLAYYRCAVQSQMPLELHNVTMEQRSVFVAGNASTVGLAATGLAAMTLYGRARQRRLEGQIRFVQAAGHATLTDDRITLHLVATGGVPGVRIKADPAAQTVDSEIPYRLLTRWGVEPHGVYLDVFGHGVIWLQPQDNGEFAQWLAHLSHEKTWQPPLPIELVARVAIVGWCQQDPRFVFGLPAGWVPPDAELFAQYVPNFWPHAVRATAITEDGDWEAQVLVVEIGGEGADLMTDPALMAADFAVGNRVTQIGPTQSANVDGQPSIFTRAVSSTTGGPADRTYVHVSRNGVPYTIWYHVVGGAVGDGSHERWLPHFHSMLASWHWYA